MLFYGSPSLKQSSRFSQRSPRKHIDTVFLTCLLVYPQSGAVTAQRWRRQVSKDERCSKWYWELTRSFCLSIVWRKEITHQGSSEDQGAKIRLLGLNPVGMKDEWPVACVRDRTFLYFGIQPYHIVLWNIPLKEISCSFSKIVLPECSVSNKALAFSVWERRSCWQGSLSYLTDVYCALFWARSQSSPCGQSAGWITWLCL